MEDYSKVDLGKESAMPSTESKKVYYPDLYLSDVQLPPLPEGEFYAKVKLRKRTYTKNYGDDEGDSCSFDVLELHVPEAPAQETQGYGTPMEKILGDGVAIMLAKSE